jgi:hypothetical protein
MTVLLCADIHLADLENLLGRFGLATKMVENNQPIPGSWFGESEAGIIGQNVYLRSDTPVHSVLHESCHYICMDDARRSQLHTNAGGDYNEENGVCYLQLILADFIPGFGRERAFSDMDEWGYTFRLGSSRAWFENDAEDALAWLISYGLIDANQQPCWMLRK